MKKFFSLALLLIGIHNVFAVPAFPDLIRFQQPNSEVFVNIYLMGDERVHWAETEDGYSLLHGDDGTLCYAMLNEAGEMVASDLMATNEEERSTEARTFLSKIPKHLRYSRNQIEALKKMWTMVEDAKSGPKTMTNVTGEKKFLVILFEFNDKSFQYGVLDFKRLFNQVNYSLNNATGSVHDYYYDVSNGLFSLHVDVVGPYTGTENTAFYGNTDNGYQYFAHEAVAYASEDVDFSDYDNDGDGYIDGLHIIFAGHGEEAGASVNCIWSHKWNIFNPPTYNNTVVDVYSCSPELSGHLGAEMTNIGVVCHELGHVFGAPDYYDTDYGSSGGEFPGLGTWDIMSSGSWNRNGKTPASHNPYTKLYIYHWVTCDTINNHTGVHVMHPVGQANADYHRINTSTNGDFFLLENRQKIKWDLYTPSHGLLVYHIHPNAHGANLTNKGHPQQIYIMAQTTDTFPNSSPSSYGTLIGNSAPFAGESNHRDSLTDNSVPSFRPWSRQPNGTPLRNISDRTDDKLLYFTINGGDPNPMGVVAEALSNTAIRLDWERYGSYATMIVMSEDSLFGTPTGIYNAGDSIDGDVVIYKGNGNSFLVEGLESGHIYHFKVFSNWRQTLYSNGVVVWGRPTNCEGSAWSSEDFESTTVGNLPQCWSGSWNTDSVQGGKAATAIITDSSLQSAGPQQLTCAPLVYDTVHGTVLKFRYSMPEGCDESTTLKVEYHRDVHSEWTTLANYHWHFGMADWNEVYLYLNNAGDYSLVRFTLDGNVGSKAAIDDVELQIGALVYAESDENGSISPRGYSVVPNDGIISFTVKPLGGYQLKKIRLNGATIPADQYETDTNNITIFTLSGLTNSNIISAEFERNLGIVTAESSTLTVYPNPTHGMVTLEVPERSEVIVYNALGQIVLRRKNAAGKVTLDLSDMSNGVYMLHCGGQTARIVKR